MKKFETGEWVFDTKSERFGRVVEHVDNSRSVKLRWMGSKKADSKEYSAARLISKTPVPFILEGILEDGIYSSSRSEQPLLSKWLGTFNDELSVKTVYQLSDIDLLSREIEHRHPPFVHINCHGDVDKDSRPYIVLLKDRLYLDAAETIATFKNFKGYPVFFSACNLGMYQNPIDEFRRAAELGPVAASTRSILDTEAMLFGLMLYQTILVAGMDFDVAVHKCLEAGKIVGITGRQGRGQAYVRLFA